MILPIPNLDETEIKYYTSDSGVDIHVPKGTPVVAVADGYVIYAEQGHTMWDKYPDTANSILIEFVTPLLIGGLSYYYAWYTHLSKLYINVADGSSPASIKQGTKIGETGLGNSVPHLHFGILNDRSQADASDWVAPKVLHDFLVNLLKNPQKDETKKVVKKTEIWYNKEKNRAVLKDFEGKMHELDSFQLTVTEGA